MKSWKKLLLVIYFFIFPAAVFAINGDANGDGQVNEADYTIWVANYNQTTTSGTSRGDFNSDAKVDGIDYTFWLANTLNSTPPTPTIQPTIPSTGGMTLESTFHAISVYWSPSGGSASNTVTVTYRPVGSTVWKTGYPLWFDQVAGQYKGSIVNLTSNTTYEVQTRLNSGSSATASVSTWNEAFPIAQTITVPYRTSPYTISQGGNANGYIEYIPGPIPTGAQANIALAQSGDNNINVNASYVIIRGFKLSGARANGIALNSAHHVVIENNEIWDWGSDGVNHDGAVYSRDSGTYNIVIQRNRMYNPHVGASNWTDGHPSGPQAVDLWNSNGSNVIRYNEAYSTNGNHFNDIFGGGTNSGVGYPGKNSDIYGNNISHAWDDCIEADGNGINVRIWGNYLSNCLDGISVSPVVKGPTYIWRNVMHIVERSPGDFSGGKGLIKTAGASASTQGRIFVFHNTTIQPNGITSGLYNGPTENVWTRNNIFYTASDSGDAFKDANYSSNNFNYDLYNGTSTEAYTGAEPNGIRGRPTYVSGASIATGYFLTNSSLGFDRGVRLDNFNDDFSGSGPDMGAYESGRPVLPFGINANR